MTSSWEMRTFLKGVTVIYHHQLSCNKESFYETWSSWIKATQKKFLGLHHPTDPVLSRIRSFLFSKSKIFVCVKFVCKNIISLDLVIKLIPERGHLTFIQEHNRHNVHKYLGINAIGSSYGNWKWFMVLAPKNVSHIHINAN